VRTTAVAQPRVLVVDGQPLFRESVVRAVRQASSLRLVAELASGRAALSTIGRLLPDVAVVDVEAPDLDGLGVVRALVRAACPTRVLLVATEVESQQAYAALVAGARGYVSRWTHADDLCAAIAAVAAGQTVLAPEAQTAVAAEIVARTRGERSLLTPRQLRILDLVAAGLSTRAIAAKLRVSNGAVKADLATVYERLDVPDRAAAVATAMRRGLLR
jgi:two-component system nitrate/nitrite response regulator NarL